MMLFDKEVKRQRMEAKQLEIQEKQTKMGEKWFLIS